MEMDWERSTAKKRFTKMIQQANAHMDAEAALEEVRTQCHQAGSRGISCDADAASKWFHPALSTAAWPSYQPLSCPS